MLGAKKPQGVTGTSIMPKEKPSIQSFRFVARAGALPIAIPVATRNPRPVPIIMVVVVIPIIMAVVAVPVVTTTVIISRGRSWGETRSPK